MTWQENKTNWIASDTPQASDLNRLGNNFVEMERNTDTFNLFKNDIWAYDISTLANGYTFSVTKGSAMSVVDGAGHSESIYNSSTLWWKTLSSFSKGIGNGAVPSSIELQNNTWYHVFVIKNTSTGVIDFAIDNNLNATNVDYGTGAEFEGYNVRRRIGSIKVKQKVGGYYYLYPMCSINGWFYMGDTYESRSTINTVTASSTAIHINVTGYGDVAPLTGVRLTGYAYASGADIYLWSEWLESSYACGARVSAAWTMFDVSLKTHNGANNYFSARTDTGTAQLHCIFAHFYDNRMEY